MVTVMWCYLVIHSSYDPKVDFHQEMRMRGIVLKAGSSSNKLSFVDDFATKHIDTSINEPIRWVPDNGCSYAE